MPDRIRVMPMAASRGRVCNGIDEQSDTKQDKNGPALPDNPRLYKAGMHPAFYAAK